MPNWCGDTLTITGKKKDLDQFETALRAGLDPKTGKGDLFGIFYPRPKWVTHGNPGHKCKGADWFHWSTGNWGTKWDVEVSIEDIEAGRCKKSLTLNFDTAWGPPTGFLLKASELYPSLVFTLEYDEPGMDFWGITVAVAGAPISEEEGPSKVNQQIQLEESEDGDRDG